MWQISMRTHIVLLLFVATLERTYSVKMDAKQQSSVVAKFSAKFLNELEKNKSIVASPLSAEILLALIALGSTGASHDELLTSLGIPDDDSIRSSFSSISSKLRAAKGITLNSANKIYIKEGEYELEPKLKDDAVKVFDAEFEKVNFSDGSAAAHLINKWVESKTNERIKDLLTPDSFGEDTRLVLVNALYFKGTWKRQFDPQITSDQPFHVDSKTTIQVPMMYKEDDYKYGESLELQAQLLQLYYEGNDASMIIVLPNEVEGLTGVIKKLADGYDLLEEIDKMFNTKVQVSIPKFKIETEIDLKSVLPKLGISSIFNPNNSGLTKILHNGEPLFVSKAVQKAFIEVNEEGAEAAAATGMVLMMRCARPPSPLFRADRPFLYLLYGSDRTVYFIGVYYGN